MYESMNNKIKQKEYACKSCGETDKFLAQVHESVDVILDTDGSVIGSVYHLFEGGLQEDKVWCGACREETERTKQIKAKKNRGKRWVCTDSSCDGEAYRDYETLAECGNPCCPTCDGDMMFAK